MWFDIPRTLLQRCLDMLREEHLSNAKKCLKKAGPLGDTPSTRPHPASPPSAPFGRPSLTPMRTLRVARHTKGPRRSTSVPSLSTPPAAAAQAEAKQGQAERKIETRVLDL